jgi:hypothetical protein
MGFVYTQLMGVSAVPTSATAIYANPAGTKSYVTTIDVHNTQSASRVVTIYLVPNSSGSLGTPLSSNEIWKFTLPALDTILIEPKFPYILMNENDAFFAVADATGVNILCKGTQYV